MSAYHHPDAVLLEILERTDAGETAQAIADSLTVKTGHRYSKGTVIGLNNRIRQADAAVPDNTNNDALLGPAWKYLGLKQQKRNRK